MSDEDRDRWDARYRAAVVDGRADPSTPAALVAAAPWLPTAGRALDLACGAGGAALALAAGGLVVDAVDVSPVALELVATAARRRGLAHRLFTIEADLDEGLPPSCAGPYDVVICLLFRSPVLVDAALALVPGGVVVAAALSTVGRDPAALGADPAFLAPPGELVEALAGFDVLRHVEAAGRADLVARRP